MPDLNYPASEIQTVLDMGPEHEEDFFRIVVSGCVTSKHLNVSRDQLVAIQQILSCEIVVEQVEHVGVPSILVQPPTNDIVPDAEHRSFIITQVQIMVGRLGMEWPDDDQRDDFIYEVADDLLAKFEITPHPHQVAPVFTPEPDLNAAVDRAKREILEHVQAGDFNGTQIERFADLHDHLDANTLGGLADDDFPLTDDEQIDFGNELQGRLDTWIRGGGLTDGIEASNDRWLTVGELRRYLEQFPEDTPITATNAGGVDWLNVVSASNPYQTGEPSLVLETRDDFHLGQF